MSQIATARTLAPAPNPVWALGLMSGTSLDGIDAALIQTDGETVTAFGPARTTPYPAALRARLRGLLGTPHPPALMPGLAPSPRAAAYAEAEQALTDHHAQAVRDLVADWPMGGGLAGVAVIGFHGQTLFHAPDQGITHQMGDGARLAAATGRPVVARFRAADVAAGGQGAPFAPAWHLALARRLDDQGRPGAGEALAVLNLGGVGNVTWIPASRDEAAMRAFDTGPGNALIDDWVGLCLGQECDRDGALAAAGQVDPAILARLLEHPHFDQPPPKSLDRDAFSLGLLQEAGSSPADGAATLTAFTAHSVARALAWMPAPPAGWLVTGGGRHNPTLMAALAEAVGGPVWPVEQAGWDGDALEAQAFAYLAVRSRRGLPLSWPGTTGVPAPQAGGWIFHPA